MADSIVFSDEMTGSEAPKADDVEEQNSENNNDNPNGSEEDQGTQDNGGNDDRPDWLPENFKTVEDFVKSQKDTQAQLTKAQQELAELKKAGEKTGDEEEGKGDGDEDADKDKKKEKDEDANRKAGRDFTEEDLEDYSKELAETGELSEESRQAILDTFDVPEFMVDTYVEGLKAMNDRMSSTIYNAFGGEEAKNAMLSWANDNLDEKDLDAIQKQFDSKDMNTIMFGIDALKARYEKAEGKAPGTRLNGKGNTATSGTFQSWDQVNRAMSDPKYRTDPAYRKEVEQKLANFDG